MAITEQNPWAMSMPDLERAIADAGKPVEVQQLDRAWAEFQAANPNFKANPQNTAAVLDYIVNPFVATAQDFKQAFALATYDKRINNEPATVDPKKAFAMPMEQLETEAFGPKEENPWALDMNALKEKAGIE